MIAPGAWKERSTSQSRGATKIALIIATRRR